MKRIMLTSIMCAALFSLGACGPAGVQQGNQSDLTGTTWSLSTLSGQPLVTGSGITIEFTSDGKVSGSSGCNRYAGAYKVSGNSIQISSPLASTMMACSQEIMDQESAYLKSLGEVTAFTSTQDQLTLKDASNKSVLVYAAQSQDLAGTSWTVTGYNNGKQAVTSVLAGTTITADFGKDGVLSGNSGCNDYNGPYKVNGNQIKIGPLASTKKACSDPAGVMDQESQYLAALETAATYQLEGNVLELRTKDGALAVDYIKR
jgi:heat shock protein HslJ